MPLPLLPVVGACVADGALLPLVVSVVVVSVVVVPVVVVALGVVLVDDDLPAYEAAAA